MALNFPDAPVDKQKYTDPATGRVWSYDAATTSWSRDAAVSASYVLYQGGLNVTAAAPSGVKAGWQYTVTTGGVAHASFTGLSGTVPAGTTLFFDGAGWLQPGAAVLWQRSGSTLSPALSGDTLAPAALPAATAAASGAVQLADAAAIAAGTAGRVVDAAQLQAHPGVPCSPAPPATPTAGALWVDSGSTPGALPVLKVFTGSGWQVVGSSGIQVSATAPPHGAAGDLWMDISVVSAPVLRVDDGTAWAMLPGRVVGSATAPSSAAAGDLWSDVSSSGSPVLKLFDGSGWQTLVGDATVASKGVVRLADAAAVTAGTAGRVVDAAQLKTVRVHVGPTAPADLYDGRAWWRSDQSKLVLYRDDGSGSPQWVDASPAATVDYSQVYRKSETYNKTESYAKAEVYSKPEADAKFTDKTDHIVGEVKWLAQAAVPAGFLKANGALVSRTVYANLFAAIGTVFGAGDGSTTFQLPDLRGEFIRGWDDGRGIDAARAFGSLQGSANLSHAHGVVDAGHVHGVNDPGHAHGYSNTWGSLATSKDGTGGNISRVNALSANGAATNASGTGISIGLHGTGVAISASGGNESRPRNVALQAVIRYGI